MLKMIIVDDEALLRNGIIHMADWEKYDVQIVGEASNGQEAIELVEKLQPDIVITDIRMPIMDGIELTKVIKENYEDTEIIILSSYSDFEFVRKTLKLGALDYILKHKMNFEDLLSIIKKISPRPTLSPDTSSQDTDIYIKLDRLLERQELGIIKTTVRHYIQSIPDQNVSDMRRIYMDLIYHCIFRLDYWGVLDKTINNKKMQYIKTIQQCNSKDSLEEVFDQFIHDVDKNIVRKQYSKIIKDVMDYIHGQYEEDISLAMVSKEFHISKEHLCNRFKKETGINYNDYVTDIRIKESKRLLSQTNLSVNEVADRVGFNSTSYFSNIFKKKVELTPSQFANLYRK